MSLYHILTYRLDFVLLLVLAAATFATGRHLLRKRGVRAGFSPAITALLAIVLSVGVWCSYKADRKEHALMREMVGGIAPTLAYELETLGHDTPLGRAGQPAELAPAYVLLASAEGSYMTGAVIAVTGGVPIN